MVMQTLVLLLLISFSSECLVPLIFFDEAFVMHETL